uniref:Uncharacterized protein n=1 Tax=Sphaerodactylus townsendi TaxID=933632 RepID=A0ACB8G6K7_9SAUR
MEKEIVGKIESDGNPSTEDESSKGQEDLSPHLLANASEGVASLGLPGHMEHVYMQQLGNSKISLSSSGVLLNGNLVSASSPPVFLNSTSFIQGPNGVILNGLDVGAPQSSVSLNQPKTSPGALSNGVPMADILAPSSEDVKDFKLLQTSMPGSAASSAAATTYSPSSVAASFPGLIPSMEVKKEENEEAIASQDGGSVVTFTGPVQINQYGIVQIPNPATTGQLLNGGIGFSSLQLPPVSVASSQGNISVNPSSSNGATFTSDSSTAQGKVFFSSLAPNTVVYTVPSSNQTLGPVKQEGLQTSLVFSQVMPLSQNGQLHESLPPDSRGLVNVTLSPDFSLAPPTLLNAEELGSSVPESSPLTSPVTTGATVISISNTNYATLQNCPLIASHDLMSISTTQMGLERVGPDAHNHAENPSVQVHPSFGGEQRLLLQPAPHIKENFLDDDDGKSASDLMMLDSKTKYMMNNMVDTICEELETGKKELAKLQTVQLDEDMQDL